MGSTDFDSFPYNVPKVNTLKSKNKANSKNKETILSQAFVACFVAIRKKQENEKEGKKGALF